MSEAFIIDGIRTPFGRYGGALSSVRADDLGSLPIKALIERNAGLDFKQVDELYYGCANQAGEDNRNVARMAGLLAGLPIEVPAATVNRLCGSGMDAVGLAARAIKSSEAHLVIAGGVESMSRAPFVMPKAETAFSRSNKVEDTTIGWRFVNKKMKAMYGTDSMPETAENLADEFHISRADQDAFAIRSQERYAAAHAAGFFESELLTVEIAGKGGKTTSVNKDEHPRLTDAETLGKLKPVVRENGTVTAGNASGVNDGSVALLLASAAAVQQHGLKARGKIVAMATSGVAPRIMGIGPVTASQKALKLAGLTLDQMDLVELNEAFAAQALSVMRGLGLADDAAHVNPNGGAIALGHPLGASGARLVLTALRHLENTKGRYALCTMCIGVGQGIAMVIERLEA